jgi:hypothetical protein
MKLREANDYKVEGHNPFYGQLQYLYPVDVKFKQMFGWQKEAFDKGKDSRFFAIQAFCGSGKSILQINLALHDIVSSGFKQKQLIVVPQEHIHRGFVADGDLNYLSVHQNDKDYQWNIQGTDNFCDGKEPRLEGLKKWLLMPSNKLGKYCSEKTISGLNSICSHAALVGVWKMLTDEEKIKAINNLTLRVDEAHHINHVLLDSEELTPEERLAIDYEATELGRVCTFILNSANASSKLHLTTATMYRGDRKTILSKEVREKFTEYNLDWIVHFRSLGIKSFYLQYEEYDQNPIDQIVQQVVAEPQEKHFIVVPSSGHKWRHGGEEYKLLIARLQKHGLKVLDLVTPETQVINKKLLLEEPKVKSNDNPSKFDAIVVCMLGREGTDWCPCSRLHNSACENSITLAVQTIGRPFRRYDGKELVKIYHYVKKFTMPKNGITKRELLVDRTNALLVCMQINDMMNPIMIAAIPKQGNKKDYEPKQSLGDFFGDQYENVLRELLDVYEDLPFEEKNWAGVLTVAEQVCDVFDVEENRENIVAALAKRLLNELAPDEAKPAIEGIDAEFIRHAGFDRLAEKFELNRSVYFGNYEEKDWKIIRNILWGNWFEKAEEMKSIGIKNIDKKHHLYSFMKQNKAMFRKWDRENGQQEN